MPEADSALLEIFHKKDYNVYLEKIREKEKRKKEGEEEEEGISEEEMLAKGISFLHTSQFSLARDVFTHSSFSEELREEVEIYKETSVNGWITFKLEEGMKLTRFGEYAKSLQLLRSIPIERNGSDFMDHSFYQKSNHEADCLFHLHRYEEAMEVLTRKEMEEITRQKSFPISCKAEHLFNVASLYMKLNEYAKALECFDETVAILDHEEVPWLYKLYCEKTKALIKAGQFSVAIDVASHAISVVDEGFAQPNGSFERLTCILLRAQAFDELNRFDEALVDIEAAYDQTRSTNSSSPLPSNQKSILLQDTNQLKVHCLQNKGGWCVNQGDFKLASNCYDEALQVLSASSTSLSTSDIRIKILFKLSAVHMKLGNHDLAEQKFTYLIQLLTTSNSSSINISSAEKDKYLLQAYSSQGEILMKRAEALVDVNSQEDSSTDSCDEKDDSEPNLTRNETFSLAVDAFKRAGAIDSTNSSVLYCLGTAQIKANQMSAAKESFQKVMVIEPGHRNASTALALCEAYDTAIAEEEKAMKEKLQQEEEEKALKEKLQQEEEERQRRDEEEEKAKKEKEQAEKGATRRPSWQSSPPATKTSPAKNESPSIWNHKKVPEEAAAGPTMISSNTLKPYQSAAHRKFNSPGTFTGTSTSNTYPTAGSTIPKKVAKADEPKSLVTSTPTSTRGGDSGRLTELSSIPVASMTRPQLSEYLSLLAQSDADGSNSSSYCHPYSSLKTPGPFPENVTSHRELYLSDEEFLKVLKVTKAEFEKFPGWKQISKKKAADLF